MERHMEFWNNTTALEKFSAFTPYVFIVLGALITATGLYLKAVFDNRIDTLELVAQQAAMNTSPDLNVKLGTAVTTDGEPIPGRTLLEITPKNDVPFNVRWHVSTREDQLVSGWMTSSIEVVPAATPVFKVPIQINADRVVNDYIVLWVGYESIYASEMGTPPHLSGEITLPYRYSDGRVYIPTPGMIDYWRSKHPSDETDAP